ncbi:YcfL family protein [Agarivorans sp. MS3-6]|uniref:YcfL family protein n=1 Tax=Agarivorans sp. TSD2052 TaxID=2937286 RepID=UPI002010237F|nr:YcfL family protein [Agarivorans sp. TSD2052]UPW16856.1 YcfL family protein [Agarivorans sp. TSD2052]
MKYFMLLFMLLVGCTTDTSGIAADSQKPDGKQWLIVDNLTLGRKLTVLDAATHQGMDRLRGVATIQSLFKGDLDLQYRFYWYDSNNVQIDNATSAWTPLSLHGKQQVQVQSVALVNTASHFKIYVREVH